MKKSIKKITDGVTHAVRLFFSSPSFRLHLSLFVGMIMNFLYLAGNISSVFINRNLWSATVTFYHLILLIIRSYLLSARRLENESERAHRVCLRVGVFLLFLDIAASVMMVYTVRRGYSMRLSGLVLFGFVFYTVYSLTSSVLGMKKWSNDNKPLHFAARNMTLAAALTSVFNLQYSLLTTIGTPSDRIDSIIALGGFLVFFVNILLAVRLIVKSAARAD